MTRATSITPAGRWREPPFDVLHLDFDDRHRRRVALTTSGGSEVLLDFAEVPTLKDGDGLVLEDGRIIRVIAAEEELAEITGPDLARLAWHLGNRHCPCQVEARRLLIRRDHVLEDMLARLGATVAHVSEPFEPEGGAYGHGRTHGHDHGHSHG